MVPVVDYQLNNLLIQLFNLNLDKIKFIHVLAQVILFPKIYYLLLI